MTGSLLPAGTQHHEEEEEYYEEGKEQGYAGEEWHKQEEGASEEEPTLVWKPVGPDERDISPTRAELRQRGAALSQCSLLLFCAGLDLACVAAVSVL